MAYPHRKRRTSRAWIGWTALALVLGVAGIVGTLWYLDLVRLPFLEKEQAVGIPPGRVAVPVSGREIPAYKAISRDDLWNPRANRFATVLLERDNLPEGVLVSMKDIMGRVLADAKPPGYVFTDSDFLPEGTREGLVGGIPPGKVAARVSAEDVRGLVDLRTGDHFSIMATIKADVEPEDLQRMSFAGPFGAQLALQANLGSWSKSATVRVIVQDGVIVMPLTVRNEPYSANTLTQGAVNRTRPLQEIVIAVDPSEVAPLMEAIAVDAEIYSILRSGRPEDAGDIVIPEKSPVSPFVMPGSDLADSGSADPGQAPPMRVVESIRGGEREMIAVPTSSDGPKSKQ